MLEATERRIAPPVPGAGEPPVPPSFPGLPDDIPAAPPRPIKEMASKTPKARAKTVCRSFIEVGSVCGIGRYQQELGWNERQFPTTRKFSPEGNQR